MGVRVAELDVSAAGGARLDDAPACGGAGAPAASGTDAQVLRLSGADRLALGLLLRRFGVELVLVAPHEEIPGSYWGESEAGLKGDWLYARLDTPLHSVLHEGSHYVCMSPERRAGLDRDAGGDDAEESAVCYLQILLADELPGVGRVRLMADMDAWGYSFRLGSTRAWFEDDASDAREWLRAHGVTDAAGRLTGRLR
ncbi:MAG TPA: hypothetical protein VMB48_07085 [Steroidobacteraceae bacterium]|nr:hypothetical protein [Steroidobacteraceae bacterium]